MLQVTLITATVTPEKVGAIDKRFGWTDVETIDKAVEMISKEAAGLTGALNAGVIEIQAAIRLKKV
jgi:hypothetical protein